MYLLGSFIAQMKDETLKFASLIQFFTPIQIVRDV